jgi:hypothetical protein
MNFLKCLAFSVVLLSLASCDYFKNSDKIKPIAEAKSLEQALEESSDNKANNKELKVEGLKSNGDIKNYKDGYITKTIYVPMNSSSIHHYDFDSIVDRADLKNDSNLTSIVEGLKVGFLNIGMNLIKKNKVKISSEFDFSFIDTEVIKGVRVKNVFFNIKGCDEIMVETCQSRVEDKDLSLSFLKEMFINFSPLQVPELGDKVDFDTTVKNYNKSSRIAFNPFLNSEQISGNSLFQNFTLANYRYKEAKEESVNDIIIIKAETDHIWDIKQLLKSDKYKDQVKQVNLIGNNIYVKLQDKLLMDFFMSRIKEELVFTNKRITSIVKCTKKQCMNFNVNQSNLITLIEESPIIKVDTFLGLNSLTKTDFEYQGLLEIEIKIDMP